MDEARAHKTRWRVFQTRPHSDHKNSVAARKLRKRRQRGQAVVEYILIMVVSLFFARFIFFNNEFGINAQLDRMMMRLGANLEQNLKTGAGPGGAGKGSLEPFAGAAGTWNN